MSNSSLYIGIVILLVILVIGFFAWTRWHKREGFALDSPADQLVQNAVGDLFTSLKTLVTLGHSFQAHAKEYARPGLEGVLRSIDVTTKALDGAEQSLSSSPPLLANYMAVYQGLSGSDRALLAASDSYLTMGTGLQKRTSPAGGNDAKLDAMLGQELITLGQQLRRIVANVHRLGAALDME